MFTFFVFKIKESKHVSQGQEKVVNKEQ